MGFAPSDALIPFRLIACFLVAALSLAAGESFAQKKVLKEITSNGKIFKLLAGRYGPYVTDGTTNASIPKSTNPESVTFEQAAELLEARRNAAPSPRRGATGGRRRAAAAAPRARKTTRKAAGA